ncbi:MAG TPA: DUF5659 domain-containing protein [Candidatus Paceibacterota bacterium]
MKTSFQPQFNCSDLHIAAYLIANGLQLIDIDKTDRKRAVFIFSDTEDREELLVAFWAKQAKVEPRAYIAAIKEVKERLYS